MSGALLSRAPLAGRYPASAAIALLGLCPFIVLTTASVLFRQDVVHALGTTRFQVELSEALSNAGYAFGAVTAADLVLRLPRRWLYVGCEAVFVAATLLDVFAGGITLFTLGRVLEGFTTGILLVVALPPLITDYPPSKVPLGALLVNLGLFGMVTLGPVAGGVAAAYGGWRLLFASIACLGGLGLVAGLLAYSHAPAPSPGIGFDFTAVPLAFAGTFLPFFAVSWLLLGGYTSIGFLVPLLVGLAALVALVASQFLKSEALMPVAPISNTLPVFGIGTAMIAGAAFTALLELTIAYLTKVLHQAPAVTGGLLAPMLIGIAIGAVLFKRLLPGRWLGALTLSGLVAVAAAGAALLGLHPGSASVLVPVCALLLGFGAGGAVAPGLFMGGLSVPSNQLGPTFALVELLRSEAAFILAPVLAYVAESSQPTLSGGIHLAIGVTFGLVVIILPALVGVLAAGGVRPHRPDLSGWLEGTTTAYRSSPIVAALREEGPDPR